MVESMTLEQFESQRLSLLDRVMNPPSTQTELSNAIWSAIGVKETIQRSDDAGSDTEGTHKEPICQPISDGVSRSNNLKSIVQVGNSG